MDIGREVAISYTISEDAAPTISQMHEVGEKPLWQQARGTSVTVINSPGTIISLDAVDIVELRRILTKVESEVERLITDQTNRLELVEQIEELQKQSENPARRRAVIKSLLTAIRVGLSASADTAQVWATWGPAILRIFGL